MPFLLTWGTLFIIIALTVLKKCNFYLIRLLLDWMVTIWCLVRVGTHREEKMLSRCGLKACYEAVRYLFERPLDLSFCNLRRDELLSYGLRPQVYSALQQCCLIQQTKPLKTKRWYWLQPHQRLKALHFIVFLLSTQHSPWCCPTE